MKPRVFIGSSLEGLDIALAVQQNLDHATTATVWNQGFQPGDQTLGRLVEISRSHDFAVFVFRADDKIEIRGTSLLSPRDNVVFELGLCMGSMGPSKAFAIIPRGVQHFRILTDLLGIQLEDYDSQRSELRAAVGSACTAIQSRILASFVPNPGFYENGVYRAIGAEWREYGNSRGTIDVYEDNVRLLVAPSGGALARFQNPASDSLHAPADCVLVRYRLERPGDAFQFYVVLGLSDGTNRKLLFDGNASRPGWGVPQDEFAVPVRGLVFDHWQSALLDIRSFHSEMPEKVTHIQGYRFRAPITVSHIFSATGEREMPVGLTRNALQITKQT